MTGDNGCLTGSVRRGSTYSAIYGAGALAGAIVAAGMPGRESVHGSMPTVAMLCTVRFRLVGDRRSSSEARDRGWLLGRRGL